MSLEDKIDGLFQEAEDELDQQSKQLESFLFEDGEMPEQLKDFDLDALEQEIQKAQPKQGVEQRKFSRADIGNHQIALKFSNQYQFARQYIDNISLGGLFVKTTDRKALGELIDIAFSLPMLDGEIRDFSLKAKVCRVTNDGLGLEFTNLDAPTKKAIENYVRKVLPSGMSVHAKAKQSTLDRLQKLRQRKEKEKKAIRHTIKATVAVLLLVTLNAGLLVNSLKPPPSQFVENRSKFEINGKILSESDVKSVIRDENGLISIRLTTDELIVIPHLEQLPYSMKHDIQLMKSLAPEKTRRKNKNAGRLTRIAY